MLAGLLADQDLAEPLVAEIELGRTLAGPSAVSLMRLVCRRC